MYLVENLTKRVIIMGEKQLIPCNKVEMTEEEVNHPVIQAYIKSKQLDSIEVQDAELVNFDDMKTKELKAYAEKEGIKLGEVTERNEIIATLKAAKGK